MTNDTVWGIFLGVFGSVVFVALICISMDAIRDDCQKGRPIVVSNEVYKCNKSEASNE